MVKFIEFNYPETNLFQVNDSHQNCHENYLEIYDGSRKENSLIQKICPGDTVQEGTALGHQMQIVHKEKNKNGQNQGFQIRIWQGEAD